MTKQSQPCPDCAKKDAALLALRVAAMRAREYVEKADARNISDIPGRVLIELNGALNQARAALAPAPAEAPSRPASVRCDVGNGHFIDVHAAPPASVAEQRQCPYCAFEDCDTKCHTTGDSCHCPRDPATGRVIAASGPAPQTGEGR